MFHANPSKAFDHETFYMDGSLSSLLNPDCFTQYCDMKAMDPTMSFLESYPTVTSVKFCSKKYLSIVHPKMEDSVNFVDRRQIQRVICNFSLLQGSYNNFLYYMQ